MLFNLLINLEHKNIKLRNYSNQKPNKVVVFEMFNINENIISFYLWSLIYKKKGFNCYIYPTKVHSNFYNPISFLIYKKLGFKILDWKLNANQNEEANKLISKINFKKLTKEKFLNLKFRDIVVGELIYDHHLRYKYLPTSNTNSPELIKTLKKAVKIIIFWDDFFKKKKVESICYSHSPYLLGLPGRVATKHNVDSLCLGSSIFRFNKKNLFLGDQFQNAQKILKNYFKKIGKKASHKLKNKYKKDFNDIMTGKNTSMIGTVAYSQTNTFKKSKKKIISDKSKFNILVSTHDFYEGPNTWGTFLFPDFYEWLSFLNTYIIKNSNKSRHWFIKPHPDGLEDQTEILKNLFKKNKNVTILPIETTHSQLIDSKINFVLTARGSVTYQYAYFKINTLICSNIGLYKDFKFVIKCKNKRDYIRKLDNMEKISKRKPDINSAINFFIFLNLFVWGWGGNFVFPDLRPYLKGKKFFFNQAKADRFKAQYFKYIKIHLNSKQLDNVFNIIENFINDKNQLVLNPNN